MRSGFVTIKPAMADLDTPEPVPFPIRIVPEPAPASQDAPSPPESSEPKRDEFYPAWQAFLAVEPKRAKTASREARNLVDEKKAIAKGETDGLRTEDNAATSWEQAAAECKAKVAAIVEECERLNQKYRDAVFDIEGDPYCLQSLHGRFPKAVEKVEAPPWIKRVEDIFDNPQFFIDGASANDVHQGHGGDCWFLASLMAVSAKQELVQNLCVARNEKIGVYGFVFYRDGEWVYEVIDDRLFLRVGDDDALQVVRDWDRDKKEGLSVKYDGEKLLQTLQRGGEALYFSHCKSDETWLPLIEKAYAKAHGDYYAIEGGFASEGIEDLTGGVAVVINPEDIMDKDRFWREQLSQVNNKYLFGGGSKSSATKGFVGGHAYTVLEVWEEGDLRLLKLRNPWGEVEWEGDWADGSKLWTAEMMVKLGHTFGDDGVFWITYQDFLKHFPSINRVRLFDKDWRVAQQWTSINVPWTVDYLDTKFEFTLSRKSPVVVVLQQPDDRYFYGLRGRYLFSLHFRVYQEGNDERYLVRSMHNSGNETVFTRSVSAELNDLEPGTYYVLVKITALRSTQAPAEEAIMKYAIERKEKLLHVGRRFDYAQTKGNLKALEETNKKRKRRKGKDKQKASWKKTRKLNMKEKERARLRKKRIEDAMKEKRAALRERETERRQKRRQMTGERGSGVSDEAQASGSAEDRSDGKGEATSTTEEEAAKKDAGPVRALSEKQEPEVPNAPPTSSTNVEGTETAEQEGSTEPKGDQANALSSKVETDEREALSKGLAELELLETKDSKRNASINHPPLSDEVDEYDCPPEQLDELDDDDFEFDSDMDGPVSSGDDQGCAIGRSGSDPKNEIFEDDPWNAMCVLGLRLYSQNADAKIRVVKGENDS